VLEAEEHSRMLGMEEHGNAGLHAGIGGDHGKVSGGLLNRRLCFLLMKT
jgi:hypothetical protein